MKKIDRAVEIIRGGGVMTDIKLIQGDCLEKMHKVCETGTCEHWALSQYIETNSEEMN